MLTPPPPICHRTVVGPARRARLPQRTPAGISRPTNAMGDFRPSLRELQRLFWRSLADEPGGGAPAPALVELVAPSATLDAGARIGVYADAYFGRLRDVLREDFPHVAALLAARFDETARGYLRAHPSEDPSVRHLGRLFADFLEQRPDLPTPRTRRRRCSCAGSRTGSSRGWRDGSRAGEGSSPAWRRFALQILERPPHLVVGQPSDSADARDRLPPHPTARGRAGPTVDMADRGEAGARHPGRIAHAPKHGHTATHRAGHM